MEPLQVPAAIAPLQVPPAPPVQVGWTGFGVQVCGLLMPWQVCATDGPVCGQSGLVVSHQSTLSFS